MRVKPLTWEYRDCDEAEGFRTSDNDLLPYYVWHEKKTGEFFWSGEEPNIKVVCSSLEDGKQACEKDWEEQVKKLLIF